MGYIIELSIVIKKLTNFTQKKHLLLDNAKKNNYTDYNEFSEYISLIRRLLLWLVVQCSNTCI